MTKAAGAVETKNKGNNAGATSGGTTQPAEEEIIVFSENHSMEDYIVGKQIG